MSQLAREERKTALVATHVNQVTRLKLLTRARENDRSLSAEIRRAIAAYLQRNDEEANTHEQS